MAKLNRKKIVRITIFVTIGLLLFAIIGKRAGWVGKARVVEVSVEAVSNQNITEVITANGKIQPETEVKISSDVSGEIVELYIKEGDQVKKGDLLLKIRPDIYISNLERMEASLNTAKANLANAKARLAQTQAQFDQTSITHKRNKTLFDQGAISQAEFDNSLSALAMGSADVEAAKQNVVSAEFTVESAEASLKEAKENLTKTSIFAPMNGTVSQLNVELGERVVGTIQMAGTELLRVADLKIMEVKVDVSENDIVRVSLGDTAIIEIDAYPNRKFKGIVTQIANSANSSSSLSTDQVTSFEVKIRILSSSYQDLIPENNPNYYPFRPGMSATVDIQTEKADNTLSVPLQAVTTRIDSSSNGQENHTSDENDYKEIVFKYKNGIVEKTIVKTGIQNDKYIQVLEGLSIGDEVVTAPYSAVSKKLKDKDPVMKVDKNNLFHNE